MTKADMLDFIEYCADYMPRNEIILTIRQGLSLK
jgi:hypothetical protein